MCSRMSLFDILARTIRLVLTFSYICGEVKGIVCYPEDDTCWFFARFKKLNRLSHLPVK